MCTSVYVFVYKACTLKDSLPYNIEIVLELISKILLSLEFYG